MSGKQLIHVAAFESTQHYKYRKPPWIRVYRRQFSTREYRSLSLQARAIFGHLQILASEYANNIPHDLPWLVQQLALPEPYPTDPGRLTADLDALRAVNLIRFSTGEDPARNPQEWFAYLCEYFCAYHSEFGWSFESPTLNKKVENALVFIGGWKRIEQAIENPKASAAARREFIDRLKQEN